MYPSSGRVVLEERRPEHPGLEHGMLASKREKQLDTAKVAQGNYANQEEAR